MGFILYGCCLIGFEPQCPHHDRFDQSLLEYQEISAYVQESTFSFRHVEFDPDVLISCQDPLKCEDSGVFSKWGQFNESSFLHSLFFHSSFHLVFEELS